MKTSLFVYKLKDNQEHKLFVLIGRADAVTYTEKLAPCRVRTEPEFFACVSGNKPLI
jgi:hypothetical protein